MQVSVVGDIDGAPMLRQWTLIAEQGDGPFVPGLICRAIARQPDRIQSGARACLAELPCSTIEETMSDLAITTRVTTQEHPTVFQEALGDRWDRLPQEKRALHAVHDVKSFSGTAAVARGKTMMARMAAWFFGFPQEHPNSPVRVTKTRIGQSELWERNFNGRILRSYCTVAAEPYRYRESFGPFTFEQVLEVSDASLHLPVRRGWFCGVPVPSFLLPRSDSREYVENGVFHFDVSLSAPLGVGLIVRYKGSLVPDAPQKPFASHQLTVPAFGAGERALL